MNHDFLKLLTQHLQNVPNPPAKPPNLWLIGTSHCHLCELAEAQLRQCQKVIPFDYQTVDIVDIVDIVDLPSQSKTNQSATSDQKQLDQLAQSIPVLVSESSLLTYPFGILDIQRLLVE